MSEHARILVEVSVGELIDKITILEIRLERIVSGCRIDRQDRALAAAPTPIADRLPYVRAELAGLVGCRDRAVAASAELTQLSEELRGVNETLWMIEDEIRDYEHQRSFGPRFVELARSVYRTNDRRAAIKRRINDLVGSRLIEAKCYASY